MLVSQIPNDNTSRVPIIYEFPSLMSLRTQDQLSVCNTINASLSFRVTSLFGI